MVGRVDAVEVDRVRVRRPVPELDPQPLALVAAKGGSGYAAVVGPGRELHAGRHLDLLVQGDQLPFAQHPAAREPPGLAVVEVTQERGRVEAVRRVVDRRSLAKAGMLVRSAMLVRMRGGPRDCFLGTGAVGRAGAVRSQEAGLGRRARTQDRRQGGKHPAAT